MRRSLCALLLTLVCLVALLAPGQADVQCDGIDDLLTSGLPLSTFLGTGTAWTITLFLQSTGSARDEALGDCWDAAMALATGDEFLAVGRTGPTGQSNACVFVQDGNFRSATGPLSAGWHHLTGRLSGTTLTLFLDGLLVDTQAAVGSFEGMNGLVQLCGAADGHSPDRLADVQIYETALSDSAIQRMAQSRLQGFRPIGVFPTAYWPLDDCAPGATGGGVTFRDRSGAVRNLTGNVGGNGNGLTCHGSSFLRRAWGPH